MKADLGTIGPEATLKARRCVGPNARNLLSGPSEKGIILFTRRFSRLDCGASPEDFRSTSPHSPWSNGGHEMPFSSWEQFFRQRTYIGLPVPPGQHGQAYQARPFIHSQWNNIETFAPADVGLIGPLPGWVQNVGGAVTIRAEAFLHEPKEAIRYFAALLESVSGQKQLFRWATAAAAVIYDRARDRLYYGISRGVLGLAIHATLASAYNSFRRFWRPMERK